MSRKTRKEIIEFMNELVSTGTLRDWKMYEKTTHDMNFCITVEDAYTCWRAALARGRVNTMCYIHSTLQYNPTNRAQTDDSRALTNRELATLARFHKKLGSTAV